MFVNRPIQVERWKQDVQKLWIQRNSFSESLQSRNTKELHQPLRFLVSVYLVVKPPPVTAAVKCTRTSCAKTHGRTRTQPLNSNPRVDFQLYTKWNPKFPSSRSGNLSIFLLFPSVLILHSIPHTSLCNLSAVCSDLRLDIVSIYLSEKGCEG